MKIRTLIVDDHTIFREGVSVLLSRDSAIEVVGSARDGLECVETAKKLKPHVVILDVELPRLNGVEATRAVLSHSNARVLILSRNSNRRLINKALQAGAAGYILKNCSLTTLLDAIKAVHAGQKYLGPDVVDIVVSEYVASSVATKSEIEKLTPKERLVLQLLAEGHSTKEIATTTDLSIKTIETHRNNLMKKLSVRSIALLTKLAIREGLTSVD